MESPASGLRLAVNTQTPLVRFRDGSLNGVPPRSLADLEEGTHYKMTTGGVVRMLQPLLARWRGDATLRDAEWIAMGAEGSPPTLRHDGIGLGFVGLDARDRRGYAHVKEHLWNLLNADPAARPARVEDGLGEDAWLSFERYQRLSAEALLEGGRRMGGLDLLYVHDFQQIGVAGWWRGPDVPKVFHLHTPFPRAIPSAWAHYLVERLARYDIVVVSTQRYAENLRAAGLRAPIHVQPPFIDASGFSPPAPGDVRRFREEFAIAEDDRIVLHVGRMDPMKGQDRLLRAFPRVLAAEPRARLVLVGNGSFSSARDGGLGLDKGRSWRARLEALAEELGVASRVTFTGHLADEKLRAAYASAEVFALPSTREGFGLAAVEAWRYAKPIVVSERAGVSDLVEDGVNGKSVDASDPRLLADALSGVLADPQGAVRMGEAGRAASRVATLDVGGASLRALFAGVMEARRHVLA